MPTDFAELPTGESICITYMRKPPYLEEFTALQSLRSKRIDRDSDVAREYLAMAPIFAQRFVAKFSQRYDAIVKPPSRHSRADPYRDALRHMVDVDLSDGFQRHGTLHSAEGCSLEELINAISYEIRGCERDLKSILIIDEIMASGRTAAALMHHLRLAGVSSECRFSIACPLWLPPSS